MSLIGALEQLSLANILQRIEMYEKNGMLVLHQGETWIELYIRGGRLICIGSVRTTMTLGEQLLQEGIISPQTLQDTYQTLGGEQPSETRIALTLMERRQLGHEDLRAWATKKALEALKVLLTWTSGEIYFEEDVAPASDRLLVSLSISALLSSLPASTPVSQLSALNDFYANNSGQEPWSSEAAIASTPVPFASSQDISEVSAVTNTGQFLLDSVPNGMSFPATDTLSPTFVAAENMLSSSLPGIQAPFTPALATSAENVLSSSLPGIQAPPASAASFTPPQPVTVLTTPKYIDTSFMRPEMVLVPVDLSALREQNPSVQMTPEQWRLLTRVDGQTSLQMACQELGLLPEQVCHIAGTLLAEGLIQLSMPTGTLPVGELSPVSQGLITAGLSNGYVVPGPAAAPAQPWSPGFSPSVSKSHFSSSLSFETQSQWGNGANGAIFVPGQGWVASPQSFQPEPSTGSFDGSGVYAPAGSQRNQIY